MITASARFAQIRRASAQRPHGTRARYVGARCRCLKCRAANSRYNSECDRAQRDGEYNGLVDASKAREHILMLSRQGVGRRSVADAASVNCTVVFLIRSGARTKIRAQTEKRILAVDADAATGKSLISSLATWKLLDELLNRGFTRCQLAAWMGYSSPAIQFKRGKPITAQSAAKVRRMFELLNAGKLRRAA